jgi:hypothetical protein
MARFKIFSKWGPEVATSAGVLKFRQIDGDFWVHETDDPKVAAHLERFKGYDVLDLQEEDAGIQTEPPEEVVENIVIPELPLRKGRGKARKAD